MKKEDFYGKWFLREGDLKPEQITEYVWQGTNRLTVVYCQYLSKHGMLFDSAEEAVAAWDNAIHAIKKKTFITPDSTEKPRIYISGPISGHDNSERSTAFKLVQIVLESKGFEVANPKENGLPDEATTNQHMRRDIEMLMTCDYIYMMRRWTHSKGCKVEFDVATAIGLPVIFEETGGLVKFE